MTRTNLLASILCQSALTMKHMNFQSLGKRKNRKKAIESVSLMQFLTHCIGMKHISDEQTAIILSVLEHTYHYDVSELSDDLKKADADTDRSAEYDDLLFHMQLILSDCMSVIVNRGKNYKTCVWRNIQGFHNLPRAFLSLDDPSKISPKDAWEWSKTYFKLD